MKSESLSTYLSYQGNNLTAKKIKIIWKSRKLKKCMFFNKTIKGTTWPPKRVGSFHQSGRGSPPVRHFAPVGVCLVKSVFIWQKQKKSVWCWSIMQGICFSTNRRQCKSGEIEKEINTWCQHTFSINMDVFFPVLCVVTYLFSSKPFSTEQLCVPETIW